MFHRMIFCLTILVICAAVAFPALAAGATPAGGGDINPVAPSAWKLDLALWTAVVFLLLLAVLTKFAWRPLAEALDKREQNVADQIAQAEAANQKAKEILADYERKLAAAEDQVRGIVEQGRRDAEQVGRELIDKAKEEAKAEFDRAVKQIDAATAAAHRRTGRPQRHAGRRPGRQDRPQQTQSRRPCPTDRAGRGGVCAEQGRCERSKSKLKGNDECTNDE